MANLRIDIDFEDSPTYLQEGRRKRGHSAPLLEIAPECSLATVSRHAEARASQRSVMLRSIPMVCHEGRSIHRGGVNYHFFGRKEVARVHDQLGAWADKLRDTVVIVADNGMVLTTYRDAQGWRQIRRKAKWRR